MLTASKQQDRRAAGRWGGPLVVETDRDRTFEEWAARERAWIEGALVEHGAIRFKRCGVDSPEAFRAAASALCNSLVDYMYRSTPRTSVGDQVYTATEYRNSAVIPLHNENAYQRDWPTRLVFTCLQPAATGGETTLASTAAITSRIDEAVKQRFVERGVMYVRNYGHGVDLPWQTVFQTSDPAEVEQFCRRENIDFEWLPNGRLRTKQVCQAVATHPATSERLWFNQAHVFHVSALGREDEAITLKLFGEANVPRNACYGDGERIPVDALTHIRAAYEAETMMWPWEAGDVLLVDNMLVAHGRQPFTGTRKVLVVMGDPISTVTTSRAQN